MLSPKRTKFRKQHRGRMRGVASKGNTIAFGQFALQSQDCGWVTARQIEASRRAMTRYIKRGGQIWIRIFPDKPVTMRPAETRMGSGKGNPEFWVAVVKPGRILFEMVLQLQPKILDYLYQIPFWFRQVSWLQVYQEIFLSRFDHHV